MWKKQKPSQHQICHQNIRHQKFIWEHHIWCHVKISEVATLVSMIPNFWCSLEVAEAELHLCFVMNGNVWWKRTFLLMVTMVVLHHKHMKRFKPFTSHVIAWSVRKGFHQSIRRTKEQKPWASERGGREAKASPGFWNYQQKKVSFVYGTVRAGPGRCRAQCKT